MKVITERTLIQGVAARWRESYGYRDKTYGADKQVIAQQLEALDKDKATAAEVKAIIGNDSWTEVGRCHECDSVALTLVQLGQDPDYESRTAEICIPCLKKSIKLARDTA